MITISPRITPRSRPATGRFEWIEIYRSEEIATKGDAMGRATGFGLEVPVLAAGIGSGCGAPASEAAAW
jgi:hypothetical protein